MKKDFFAVAGIPWTNRRKETWPRQFLLYCISRRTA